MGLPRSTFYDVPAIRTDGAEIVARITMIVSLRQRPPTACPRNLA
jgi:hypothetical protein